MTDGSAKEGPAVLKVHDLSKVYQRGSGTWRRKVTVTALDSVSFDVSAGSTIAVVGESGAGKSTLARCLALLEDPTSGEVYLDERRVDDLAPRAKRQLRPRLQLIFQDPASAVNPRLSAVEAVAEPLYVARWGDRSKRRDRALELMVEVGLPAELAERSALELSGGQKQRLVLARALAAGPEVLILDEGLAGLDLSMQAQVVKLLNDLQQRYELTCVFITHDLRLVAHLADNVFVMDRGRLVESGAPREVLARPRHEATRQLVSSMLGP